MTQSRKLYYILRFSLNIPEIVIRLKNWYLFLTGYFKPYSGQIRFRNNLILNVDSKSDLSSISVIFFKKEYGLISSNSTILDIGANKGYFSIYAAEKSKNSIIYSFEPVKTNFSILKKNIHENGFDQRIQPVNIALAGKTEKRNISLKSSIEASLIFKNNFQNKEVVSCLSFNDMYSKYNLKLVDLIKMDCEGAEYEILYNTDKDVLYNINEIRMEYHNIDNEFCNIECLNSYMKKKEFIIKKFEPFNENIGIIWFKNKNYTN